MKVKFPESFNSKELQSHGQLSPMLYHILFAPYSLNRLNVFLDLENVDYL